MLMLPPGHLCLCSPAQNELPSEESPKCGLPPTTCSPGLLCVDNSQLEGHYTSGFIGPRDVSITVRNITHSQTKQALRPILVGPGAVVGLVGPWGGFAYQGLL